MSRRKPPYHHRAAVALSTPDFARMAFASGDSHHITMAVACGPTAWDIGRRLEARRALFVVSPPGEEPDTFGWHILAGHDPILLFSDDGSHDALVAALIRDGVKRVMCCRTGRRWIGGASNE